LEECAHGRARLTPEILDALAKDLFGTNTSYDPAADKLRRAGPKPTPLGGLPAVAR
jgi:hypothetical protein